MTEQPLDRRPARSSAALAGTVAAALALVIALWIGSPIPALCSLLGGLSLAGGGWALGRDSNARIAVGSIGTILGTVLLSASAMLAATGWGVVSYLSLGLGVAFVSIEASSDIVPATEGSQSLGTALRESANALLIGIVVAVLVNINAQFGVVGTLTAGLSAATVYHPLVGFVTLQIGAVLAMLLLSRALPIVRDWVPSPSAATRETLSRLAVFGRTSGEIPKVVGVVIAIQFFFSLSPTLQRVFDSFLASVPVVGPVLRVILSGPLHAVLGGIIAVLLAILLADALQNWLGDWLGDDPGYTVALQAGGIAAVVVTLAATAALRMAGKVVLPSGGSGMRMLVGPAAVLLGLLLVLLTVFGLLVYLVQRAAETDLLPRHTAGFALGSALLLLGTLLAAGRGLPPVLVFTGAAGALLVWDTGAHASSIGRQLGRDSETTDAEFLHVTGTGLVLAGAVLLAVLARYVLIPVLLAPTTPELAFRSVLALGLILVAMLSFTLALLFHDDGATWSQL